jgi:hypothetical protein
MIEQFDQFQPLEVVQRLKNYLLAHPDLINDTTAWIQGMGWDHTKWTDSSFPSAVSYIGMQLRQILIEF